MKKRYQLYLEKDSVELLDRVAELTEKTRSEIVREGVDNMAAELNNKIRELKSSQENIETELQKMIGAASFKPKMRARNLDSIYETIK